MDFQRWEIRLQSAHSHAQHKTKISKLSQIVSFIPKKRKKNFFTELNIPATTTWMFCRRTWWQCIVNSVKCPRSWSCHRDHAVSSTAATFCSTRSNWRERERKRQWIRNAKFSIRSPSSCNRSWTIWGSGHPLSGIWCRTPDSCARVLCRRVVVVAGPRSDDGKKFFLYTELPPG